MNSIEVLKLTIDVNNVLTFEEFNKFIQANSDVSNRNLFNKTIDVGSFYVGVNIFSDKLIATIYENHQLVNLQDQKFSKYECNDHHTFLYFAKIENLYNFIKYLVKLENLRVFK